MKTAMYYLIIATAFVTSPTYASSVSKEQVASTKRVSIGGLDLSDRHDRAIFDARIRGAARSICENLNGAYSAVVAECVTRSVQKARPQRNAQVARHVRFADAQRSFGPIARPIG
jgi:UrcA family protein